MQLIAPSIRTKPGLTYALLLAQIGVGVSLNCENVSHEQGSERRIADSSPISSA